MKEPSSTQGWRRETYSGTVAKAPEEQSPKSEQKNLSQRPGPKKTVVFDGVLMPGRDRLDGTTGYSPRNHRKKEGKPEAQSTGLPGTEVEERNTEKVTSTTDREEELNQRFPKPQNRPFDGIRPLPYRYKPEGNTWKDHNLEKVEVGNKEGPQIKVRNESRLPAAQPAFKLRNELFKEGLAEELANRYLEGAMPVKLSEAGGLFREVAAVITRKLRNRKVAPKRGKSSYVTLLDDDGETEVSDRPKGVLMRGEYIDIDDLALAPEDMFEVLKEDRDGLRAGSIIQKDVIECFLNDLDDDDGRKSLIIVAGVSQGLRVIGAKINDRVEEVEGILDYGSQIIAMDRLVATHLGLSWDPKVTLQMQDSHGGLGRTEGLARNVPFKFGQLTIYLQVHVQNRAPYMLLLGRPFDVVTESSLKTFANGDAEVTITDPNTGNQCVLPTYPRGQLPSPMKIDTSRYNDKPVYNKIGTDNEGNHKGGPKENFQSSTI